MEWQNPFSSTTVNYTLSGKRIDVQLRGSILPGSESTFERVLITTEDITLIKMHSVRKKKSSTG